MEFDNQFWVYFICVIVIASLIYVIALAVGNRKTSSPAGETTGHVWDEDLTEYDNPLPRWWLYLLFLTVIFSVGYLLLYPGMLPNGGFLKWTQQNQHARETANAQARYSQMFSHYEGVNPSTLAKDTGAMRTASRLFAHNCAACHGTDARGAPGIPNLRDDDWIYGSESETILKTILDGRIGVMPGWEAVLGGPEGTLDTAHYVLQLSGRSADAERAAQGEQKFKTVCVACHNMDGTGNPQLGGVNLTDDIWLHGSSLEEIVNIIGQGVNNQMPAHRDTLGETKSRLLAGYVISLSD